jgi:hypothetical protein
MADLVHCLTYPPVPDQARPVLHVFATPERALAQVERKLAQRGDGAQKVAPLPFVSIERIADAFDPKRASCSKFYRLWRTPDYKTYYGMQYPIPMILTYQISLWSREIQDINDLMVQWMLMFDHSPMKYIRVEHPFPLWQLIVPVFVTEIAHVPTIPNPEAQRLVRKTITCQVYGWIVRAADRYPVIEKVITNVYSSGDMVTEGDLLGHVVVT